MALDSLFGVVWLFQTLLGVSECFFHSLGFGIHLFCLLAIKLV